MNLNRMSSLWVMMTVHPILQMSVLPRPKDIMPKHIVVSHEPPGHHLNHMLARLEVHDMADIDLTALVIRKAAIVLVADLDPLEKDTAVVILGIILQKDTRVSFYPQMKVPLTLNYQILTTLQWLLVPSLGLQCRTSCEQKLFRISMLSCLNCYLKFKPINKTNIFSSQAKTRLQNLFDQKQKLNSVTISG